MEQSPTFFDPTLFLLFGFMILIYFLMIRPENKRRKTHQEMISSLETEQIHLEMSAPNRAGILLPEGNSEDGEDILMLVMPVMLNN